MNIFNFSSPIIYLIFSLLFLLLSFFFSMAETSFTCLNKYRFQVESKKNRASSIAVCKVIDTFDNTLVAILIGNNIVNILLSIVSTSLFLSLMINVEESLVSLIASIIVTSIVYIFAEALPKQIAKRIPNKCARAIVYPLIFFLIILFPLTLLFSLLSRLINFIFRKKKEYAITEEDFNDALITNEKEGVQDKIETEIIKNSFDFSDTLVKDVLTERQNMFMIDIQGLTNKQLIKKVMNTSYSRIPVYYTNPNKILGVIVVKELLSGYYLDPHLNIRNLIDKPYIISPNIYLDELIEGLRNNKTEIAFVYLKDKLLGMVTLEDVLEELVGPIDEGVQK